MPDCALTEKFSMHFHTAFEYLSLTVGSLLDGLMKGLMTGADQ